MEKLAPQWIVSDLKETVTFYTEKLGFQVDWIGTLFAIVSCGGVIIMFRQLKKEQLHRPNKIPFIDSGWHTTGAEAWDAYIWVSNVDELYEALKEKNVTISKELQNTEYGNRDFEIEDVNGYILCFGKSLS